MRAQPIYFNAGNELLRHGYESEGMAVLERAEALHRSELPETQDNYRLGVTLLFLGGLEEARVIFEQLTAEAPDSLARAEALGRVAMAAASLGDRETAIRISDELAPPRLPPHAWGYFARSRAMIAGALGDCDRAVELLKEAASLGDAHCFIHRRYGLMNCRDHQGF